MQMKQLLVFHVTLLITLQNTLNSQLIESIPQIGNLVAINDVPINTIIFKERVEIS